MPAPRNAGVILSKMLTENGEISQARGFIHFKLEKRAKSESVEASWHPCSIASAAKCASVARLATA